MTVEGMMQGAEPESVVVTKMGAAHFRSLNADAVMIYDISTCST
jgi:hypothetical protein